MNVFDLKQSNVIVYDVLYLNAIVECKRLLSEVIKTPWIPETIPRTCPPWRLWPCLLFIYSCVHHKIILMSGDILLMHTSSVYFGSCSLTPDKLILLLSFLMSPLRKGQGITWISSGWPSWWLSALSWACRGTWLPLSSPSPTLTLWKWRPRRRPPGSSPNSWVSGKLTQLLD